MTRVAVLDPAKPGDHLTQMGGGAELQSLRRHVPNQVLGQNFREAGDIEDVFLRIQGHQLPAERGQGIDDTRGGAAHPSVESGKEARRASSDDRDVFEFLLGHVHSCVR